MKSLTFLSVLVLCARLTQQQQQTVEVTVPDLITVRGSYTQDGIAPTRVNSFLGIPYAQAPIDALRFEPPVEHPGLAGVKDATMSAGACVQMSGNTITGSEDCLHLDIYVPGEFDASKSLPVMIYIHGGQFLAGSSEDYTGNGGLITDPNDGQEIILVSINYRLGLFGFMSSGDSVMPGNMGLKDQAMAIKWVHDHISHFGGDNTRVTLFGQAEGGKSVFIQALREQNADMFQRVVIQSGGLTREIPDKALHINSYIEFAQMVGCSGDSVALKACLQNAEPAALLTATGSGGFNVPLVDGDFITQTPDEYLQSDSLTNLDLLIGFNSEEASIWLDNSFSPEQRSAFLSSGLPVDSEQIDEATDVCLQVTASVRARTALGFELENKDELASQARAEYSLVEGTSDTAIGRGVLDMIRDCTFAAYSFEIAKRYAAAGSNTFVYYFDHRSTSDASTTAIQLRAEHDSELPYVFGTLSNPTNEDTIVSQSLQRAWRSFATVGTPTYLTTGYQPLTWPSYTVASPQMLRVNRDTLVDASRPTDSSIQWEPVRSFWADLRDEAMFTATSTPKSEQNRESCNDEEFESEFLKLDEFEADLVIIILVIAVFFLLLLSCGLALKICYRGDTKAEDKYAY